MSWRFDRLTPELVRERLKSYPKPKGKFDRLTPELLQDRLELYQKAETEKKVPLSRYQAEYEYNLALTLARLRYRPEGTPLTKEYLQSLREEQAATLPVAQKTEPPPAAAKTAEQRPRLTEAQVRYEGHLAVRLRRLRAPDIDQHKAKPVSRTSDIDQHKAKPVSRAPKVRADPVPNADGMRYMTDRFAERPCRTGVDGRYYEYDDTW